MMPRSADQLLLPVNPIFILVSLLLAFVFNVLPIGRAPWMPDVVALTLTFWCVHQPRRIGMGIAFLSGLVMDVHSGALLGQHALAYTLLSFFAIAIHRRLLWFSLLQQAMQVTMMFVAAHAVSLGVRMMAGDMFPGWSIALAAVLEGLLWPVASLLLLAPQRRAPDPDENRPL